jgi:hypothetical protein
LQGTSKSSDIVGSSHGNRSVHLRREPFELLREGFARTEYLAHDSHLAEPGFFAKPILQVKPIRAPTVNQQQSRWATNADEIHHIEPHRPVYPGDVILSTGISG